jgi:hypothetical protein
VVVPDPGVVHQNVQTAALFDDQGHGIITLVLTGHVESEQFGLAILVLNIGKGVPGPGFIGPEIEIHKDAPAGQMCCNGTADAPGCTADQSDLLNRGIHADPLSPIDPDFNTRQPE